MKTIQLSRGFETIVDDAVYETLMQHGWKWHYDNNYALTNIHYYDGSMWTARQIRLHRWIWESWANRSLGGLQIDHINGDGLDNRLENLRIATISQNCRNRGANKNNIPKLKGVYFKKSVSKYCARIMVDGKPLHLGYFTDCLDAIKAYDNAAQHYHGDFAYTNIKPLSELKAYLRSLIESRGGL